jgi:hypothetical protein
MALIACNNLPVAEARISLPLFGVWVADLLLAAGSGISPGDAVTVSISGGALDLVGTARRAEAFEDALQVQVVGGAGGMSAFATAKAYRGATFGAVLSDLADAAGESISGDASADILATLLPRWQTLARPVSIEVATLFQTAAPGTAWRVLPSGSLWLGEDSWADADFDLEVHERDARAGRIVLSSEAPLLLPGTAIDGDRIGDIEHTVTAGAVRTVAWIYA